MGILAFFEQYSGAITAFATVVIGVLTYFMVRVSRSQARLTRQALIADKRAYLYPIDVQPFFSRTPHDKTPLLAFNMIWKNSGFTPTRDLACFVDCELRDLELPPDFKVPKLVEGAVVGKQYAVGMIPPQVTGGLGIAPNRVSESLSLNDMTLINTGKKYLYIFGRARYNDIFDSKTVHIIEFCWRIKRIDVGTPVNGVSKLNAVWLSHVSGFGEENIGPGRWWQRRWWPRR